MLCLECDAQLEYLDNQHLLDCCGLTLQEYAIRYHQPLDLLVPREQINQQDFVADYAQPSRCASELARAVLRGIKWAGLLRQEDGFVLIPGEVRRLDLLLWDLQALSEYGFRFRQEYKYSEDSHRVVAYNRLKVPVAYLDPSAETRLSPIPPPDFTLSLAVFVAHVGELQAGYLFLNFAQRSDGRAVTAELSRHRIQLQELDAADHPQGVLLRTRTRHDTQQLLALLERAMRPIPGALQRLDQATPEVTVCKELVFDSAHFITDHPAKCSNLHGGRYLLQVKVKGRVDPVTGCVVDYGYLKRVANLQVVERFDHHNLNYTASALAWRSSTEMLCVYIWERLIDYLPGLAELQLYETTQSWCHYRGPSLAEFQKHGRDALLTHYTDPALGSSPLRQQLMGKPRALELVAKS